MVESVLRFDMDLPWDSQSEDLDFETIPKIEAAARKFHSDNSNVPCALRVDHSESTRLEVVGMGPGRVLCREKNSEQILTNHPSSSVWVSAAGFLLRCSPEQLRPD